MGSLSVPSVDPILYGSLARSSREEGLAGTVAGAKGLAGGKASGGAAVDRLLGEFQSVLFSEMMKAMRASIPKSGLFEDNTARDIFESLLDDQYARSFGDSVGSLGLTEALKTQLGVVGGDGSRMSGKTTEHTEYTEEFALGVLGVSRDKPLNQNNPNGKETAILQEMRG